MKSGRWCFYVCIVSDGIILSLLRKVKWSAIYIKCHRERKLILMCSLFFLYYYFIFFTTFDIFCIWIIENTEKEEELFFYLWIDIYYNPPFDICVSKLTQEHGWFRWVFICNLYFYSYISTLYKFCIENR